MQNYQQDISTKVSTDRYVLAKNPPENYLRFFVSNISLVGVDAEVLNQVIMFSCFWNWNSSNYRLFFFHQGHDRTTFQRSNLLGDDTFNYFASHSADMIGRKCHKLQPRTVDFFDNPLWGKFTLSTKLLVSFRSTKCETLSTEKFLIVLKMKQFFGRNYVLKNKINIKKSWHLEPIRFSIQVTNRNWINPMKYFCGVKFFIVERNQHE